MNFFKFGLNALSMEEVNAILQKMSTERGGSGGRLAIPDVGKAECYVIFPDPVDAGMFRQHLEERGVQPEEPADLPAELKSSIAYQVFLKVVGS